MTQPPGGAQPPYGTPQPYYPQQPPPSRANVPLIAAIGCGGLVVVGALATVLFMVLSNRDDPASQPAASSSVSSNPQPDCQFGTDDTFLPDCAGTWSGDYIQTKPTIVKYYSKLTITGDAKTASITFSGNGLDCSGTVTILSNTDGYKALVRADITSGRSTGVCASVNYGTITPTALEGPEKLVVQLFSSRTAAVNNEPSDSVGGLIK